jgi:hypothetical protein
VAGDRLHVVPAPTRQLLHTAGLADCNAVTAHAPAAPALLSDFHGCVVLCFVLDIHFVSHVLHSSMLIDTPVVLVSKPDLCCGVLLV